MSLCKPNGLHVVTINIIYPWRQSVNFPSFPTDTELFEVLGEYSKDWCLHRMKTNVLSFSVPTGPLAGEYERPEDLRIRALFNLDLKYPMNVDLRLVSKLSSPAPDSELSSEIVALRDAVKVLTDRVVANTQFPDKPSAPVIPPSSSSFSSMMTDLQKYMDVAEGKNKDYYEDKEIDDTLSSAAKNWEIIVNTDNLFTSTTAVLRFPRFPTHSEFLYLMRQLTRPTSTAADLRPPNLLMEVQDGRFEGKYESFDTLRETLMLTTNAARETHKHLNIRLTRRTIASEISGSSGSSEYDAAADIVEEWQRIESAASSSDVIVENLCSTPGSPAGDEPASKNTAIRHVAAIRQNKVQPTDSSEGVALISATPIVLKDDYVPYDVQDIASRDGSPRLSPTTEEAASSPPSLEKRRETFGSGEWDKVPANAEVSSSPVEDMATMINALADRIAALPAPTSSIVPANVRAPAPFESSGSSTSAKEKTSAHPAMTGPTDPVGPGGERVKSPRLPIDSPNEAESEAVEYTFYIYNNLHAKKTPMIKHCKSLPLLKDVCAWIEDMWGATPEPNEILAHESPNETEIKIQHWLNKEVGKRYESGSELHVVLKIGYRNDFSELESRKSRTRELGRLLSTNRPPHYTEADRPSGPKRRLTLVNLGSSPYRACRLVAELPDLSRLRLVAADLFTSRAAAPGVHEYRVAEGGKQVDYDEWRKNEIAQGRLRGASHEVVIHMTQVDRHAAQAAAQPAKSSGSYGISADVATSEAITPSLVQGAARGPRPDGVASTPNSSAYLGSLLAAKNNTPASTRLLHILETEAVSLDTSLGLQLLDLVAALRLDGKLTPAGQIDKRAYLRPTSLEPIENRLNDFAGMLNVIAEAVGVNLLENDEDTSPVTAKATSRTTGAPAVTSWAETTTGKDRVVQPVHDLPDSPAAQKVMKRPLGLAQLTDILESAQKLNVPSDGRHHVDTPDAPAGSSVQHPGQASARMRAINTDEPVFGRPSLRSSAPPNQQWHLGFWETDRSRQEAPSSSSAEYRPSTGVYFPPRPWAPTTTSGLAPYAHAYPYGPRSAYNPSSHHQSALYSPHSAGDWASNPYVPSWSTAEQRPMPPVFPFSRQFAFGDAAPPRSVPHRNYQDYPNANSRAQDSLRSSWEARK